MRISTHTNLDVPPCLVVVGMAAHVCARARTRTRTWPLRAASRRLDLDPGVWVTFGRRAQKCPLGPGPWTAARRAVTGCLDQSRCTLLRSAVGQAGRAPRARTAQRPVRGRARDAAWDPHGERRAARPGASRSVSQRASSSSQEMGVPRSSTKPAESPCWPSSCSCRPSSTPAEPSFSTPSRSSSCGAAGAAASCGSPTPPSGHSMLAGGLEGGEAAADAGPEPRLGPLAEPTSKASNARPTPPRGHSGGGRAVAATQAHRRRSIAPFQKATDASSQKEHSSQKDSAL